MRKNPKRKLKITDPLTDKKTKNTEAASQVNEKQQPNSQYQPSNLISKMQMKKVTQTGISRQTPLDIFQSPIPVRKNNTVEFYSANLRQLSPLPFFQSKVNTISYQHKDLQFIQTPQIHNQKNELNELSGVQSFDCILDFDKIYADKDIENQGVEDIVSEDVFSASENSQQQLTPIEQQKSKQNVDSKENIRQRPVNQQLELQQQQIRISKETKQKNQEPAEEKKNVCSCKKSKCLKLYCDCFRLNKTCDGCSCIGCHNTEAYQDQRNNAIFQMIDKNQEGFRPKIEGQKHSKGCNCKKSMCLKKYCECFQAGLKCCDLCRCELCKNTKNQQ